jgi:hypothetical protein
MKKVTVCLVVAMALVFGAALVSQAATLDEAKALGIKAAEFVKANGRDKGIEEIGNPKGRFSKGELYVTLHGFDGVVLAFSPNPKMVGLNNLEVKDPDGRYLTKETAEIAKTKGGGWVEYSWVNPATKKIGHKKAWVQRVEGMDIYTLCGVFQN